MPAPLENPANRDYPLWLAAHLTARFRDVGPYRLAGWLIAVRRAVRLHRGRLERACNEPLDDEVTDAWAVRRRKAERDHAAHAAKALGVEPWRVTVGFHLGGGTLHVLNAAGTPNTILSLPR
jgi:hypothetical protein